jgi:hypothetical protein
MTYVVGNPCIVIGQAHKGVRVKKNAYLELKPPSLEKDHILSHKL